MKNSIPPEERLEIKKKTHKNMMYLTISSLVMIFLGLASGYYVAKSNPTWVSITIPPEFFKSTIIILLSSVTFFIAVLLAKKGNFKLLPVFMVLTLILGFLFVNFQLKGWKHMTSKGMFLSDIQKLKGLVENPNVTYGEDYTLNMTTKGKQLELKMVDGKFYDIRDEYNSNPLLPNLDSDNVASSWMYVLSGLHLAHLIGGLISLIVVTIKSFARKYNEDDIVGIQVSSIYWHFLDILWLSLLCLLYFLG
jgi:cytochrome c oxidase subunit 3